MRDMAEVRIGQDAKKYPIGYRYLDIAKEYQNTEENDIVLVMVNGKLCELHKTVIDDCEMKLITTATSIGLQTYKRSVTLLLLKAFYDVAKHENVDEISVLYSVSKGYYCKVRGKVVVNQDLIDRVKARMCEIVADDIPIIKRSVNTEDAVDLFRKHRMLDKEKLFRYRRVSKVNLYSLHEYEDYYYGYMVPSSGYLKYFDLFLYDEGFVIQFPTEEEPKVVPPFEPRQKLFQVLKESGIWSEKMGVDTVGALNDFISKGKINEIILIQEALHEKKLAEIAEVVAAKPDKKLIMIAGPSSSGKTTFSHRLSIQLTAHGLKPHPIAVDNYFVNREFSPRDEFGNYNFEVLEALDVEQFNKDMTRLLNGDLVEMPVYNFKTGQREYKGDFLQLGKDDILVIEGIHGLNDKLSYSLPKESKFKIYLSALTQLNIDEHNRIPTTDGRLLRRMVRDARTRGTTAQETIARWQSVRQGEESYIFPFQEEADVMFNSALIYELSVIKQYAEPLLFGIPKDSPEYFEAKRLLKFLDYFLGVSSEDIPKNSLVREFIGGSCFKV